MHNEVATAFSQHVHLIVWPSSLRRWLQAPVILVLAGSEICEQRGNGKMTAVGFEPTQLVAPCKQAPRADRG